MHPAAISRLSTRALAGAAASLRRPVRMPVVLAALLAVVLALAATGALADNIDQNNTGQRYGWGENIGWLKARPATEAYAAGGSGLQVTDTDVLGYLWGENIGWVNFSCQNDSSCGGAAGAWGVKNDGAGHLSGYAWGENVGWINFSCTSDASCGGAAGTWGVTIATPGTYDDLSTWGTFHGYAWGENVGWISVNCLNDGSCGTTPYRMQTGWPNSSGDGYADTQHTALGKDPFAYCPIMRADINGDGVVNGVDLNMLAKYFTQSVPPAPARRDLNNPPDGILNGVDLNVLAKWFTQPVTNCP